MVAAPFGLVFSVGVQAKPEKAIELDKTKITVPGKVGDVKAADLVNRTAVGERFLLWLSINPTDCHDPVLVGGGGKDDKSFDLYGKLTVNGAVKWEVTRSTSRAAVPFPRVNLPANDKIDPRKDGLSLNQAPFVFMAEKRGFPVSTRTSNPGQRTVRLSLQLFDQDSPIAGYDYNQSDRSKADNKDDKIGDFKINLDLSKLGQSDGRYYWFWNSKDESGNPIGTNLFLFAEHVGTVYESVQSGPPKPHVDPKIKDKKFPKVSNGRISWFPRFSTHDTKIGPIQLTRLRLSVPD